MTHWRETIRKNIDRLSRRFEPDLAKHRYYQYLEERRSQMYEAVYNQSKLIEALNYYDFSWTIDDLGDITQTARALCDFGIRCDLFDDTTYAKAICANDTDINSLAAVIRLYNQSFREAQQKANQGQLTALDLRRLAAVSYHLQSLRWLISGICPILHSPYRLRSSR